MIPIENFTSKLAAKLTTTTHTIIQELFKEELSIKNFLKKSFSPINTIRYILCITFFIDFLIIRVLWFFIHSFLWPQEAEEAAAAEVLKLQQELEMEEAGLEPHPEEDEDLAVEDNHGKISKRS